MKKSDDKYGPFAMEIAYYYCSIDPLSYDENWFLEEALMGIGDLNIANAFVIYFTKCTYEVREGQEALYTSALRTILLNPQ